jgi:hypothetical protein
MAQKYGRFFILSDEDYFAVAVETNLNRKITVVPNSDHTSVLLKLNIPVPPDELVQASGFHAVQISLTEVDESFEIPTGKKISGKSEKIFYPNEKTPLWITFKFEFSKEVEETQLTFDEDLIQKFVGKDNK